jgi:hypothetical protein
MIVRPYRNSLVVPRRLSCLAAPVLVSSLLLRSGGHPERQTAPGHYGGNEGDAGELWQEPTL